MRNASIMPLVTNQTQTWLRKAITFLAACVLLVCFVDAARDFYQGFKEGQAACCPK